MKFVIFVVRKFGNAAQNTMLSSYCWQCLKSYNSYHSPGPMAGGSNRYIVPGPDNYLGARDWRNVWVFVTNKLGIM